MRIAEYVYSKMDLFVQTLYVGCTEFELLLFPLLKFILYRNRRLRAMSEFNIAAASFMYLSVLNSDLVISSCTSILNNVETHQTGCETQLKHGNACSGSAEVCVIE